MLAKYQDRAILDNVYVETAYSSKNQAAEQSNQQIAGSYALIVNHRGPCEKQITKEKIFDSCNQELACLVDRSILPEAVGQISEDAYLAVLYSAGDVLEPRNNVAVWKLGFSDEQKNVSRQNKLMEVTPYFKKYMVFGTKEEQTVVTIGYYEGINELFLKVSK